MKPTVKEIDAAIATLKKCREIIEPTRPKVSDYDAQYCRDCERYGRVCQTHFRAQVQAGV